MELSTFPLYSSRPLAGRGGALLGHDGDYSTTSENNFYMTKLCKSVM